MKAKVTSLLTITTLFFACSSEMRNGLIIKQIDKLFQEERYQEAKMSVDSFISLNPKHEMAWTLKGHIEESLNNDSVAVIAYEKALAIDPHMEQALTGMGIIYRKRGEYNKAAGYYAKAIEENPNYAQAYSSLVAVELKRKNFENAVKLGEKGYQLDSIDPIIAANLAIAYHYYGDTLKRDDFYKRAKDLKYSKLDVLQMIFKGEATIFEE